MATDRHLTTAVAPLAPGEYWGTVIELGPRGELGTVEVCIQRTFSPSARQLAAWAAQGVDPEDHDGYECVVAAEIVGAIQAAVHGMPLPRPRP
jgi:hypothetical protein